MKRAPLRLVPRFEPEPEPEKQPTFAPAHPFIVTGLTVITLRTGERRELDHLAWPEYGVNDALRQP